MAGSAPHGMTPHPTTRDVYHRLVLWNIGLTLVDAARVDRAAYAEAFRATTGRPLVQLPQMAGRTDSEIFFEALAVNAAGPQPGDPADEELLGRFTAQLATAFGLIDPVTTVCTSPGSRHTAATASCAPGMSRPCLVIRSRCAR